MSKYGWEKGTLKLSAAAWKQLRDRLVEVHNEGQKRRYEMAVKLHERLMVVEKQKGKLVGFIEDELASDELGKGLLRSLDKGECGAMDNDLLGWRGPDAARDLMRPLKKNYPSASASKVEFIGAGEGSIHFDHRKRELTWSVPENNHAVEDARNSRMGRELFRALAGVAWTRGTGGTICGNDEYNQENECDGGGSNYVTARFGPLGEDKVLAKMLKQKAKSAAGLTPARIG